MTFHALPLDLDLPRPPRYSRLSTLSYVRPDDSSGASTIGAINRWLEHGLALSGGRDSLGFLFLYELMTASLKIAILPSDSPYVINMLEPLALHQTGLTAQAGLPSN